MTCINKKLEKQICDVSFRPRSWSGGYAILITLLESEQGGIGFMRKKEITISAQRYSDTSFSTADKNSYNGWSSMSVLIKKSFVTSSNSPVKYSLTITGRKLAMEFQNQMGLMKVQNNSCHCRTIQRQESTPHMNKKLSNYNAIPERGRSLLLPFDSNSGTFDEESVSLHSKYPLTLAPDSYSIILICDKMEFQFFINSNKRTKSDKLKYWMESGIKYETRRLICGDFIWIAKSGSKELVLPYIVESKRLDDLSKSVIDNRYQEQKRRMVSTGLKPIYILEMNSFKGSLDRDTLMNAVFLTNIRDDFIIKFTRDVFDTMRYLLNFTKALLQLYTGLTLHSQTSKYSSQPFDSNLIMFDYFQDRFTKTIPHNLTDMFAKTLLQIPRITENEASAIIGEYPTLSHLLEQYKSIDEKNGKNLLRDILISSSNMKSIGPTISFTMYNLYN